MAYPTWFPRPKHWLKSLDLFAYNIPSLFVLKIVSRYYVFYGTLIIDLSVWGIIYVFVAFLSYYLSFCYLHFWIWREKDPNPKHLKWLPSNKSLIKGAELTLISILSYGITVLILFPFIDSYREDWFMWLNFVIWIIATAYIYFIQDLIANKKGVTK